MLDQTLDLNRSSNLPYNISGAIELQKLVDTYKLRDELRDGVKSNYKMCGGSGATLCYMFTIASGVVNV